MNYEVDESNTVRVYQDGEELPFVLQPDWPNGQSWTREEATSWAEALIAHHADSTADLPGNNPTQPTIPAPVIEETPAE